MISDHKITFFQYQPVEDMGYDEIIFTLYRTSISPFNLATFVSNNQVDAITMPALLSKVNYIEALKGIGIPVYGHTVNDEDFYTDMTNAGFYGIYTDYLIY